MLGRQQRWLEQWGGGYPASVLDNLIYLNLARSPDKIDSVRAIMATSF